MTYSVIFVFKVNPSESSTTILRGYDPTFSFVVVSAFISNFSFSKVKNGKVAPMSTLMVYLRFFGLTIGGSE